MSAVVLIHTADLHDRLSAAAASWLADLKRKHAGALLLDAGDAVGAWNLTYRLAGEPILRLMAEAGYDAMAMGNRESHPWRRGLERKLRDASFPVLAANIRAIRQPLPDIVRGHAFFDAPAGRVAVMGLAPQMTRAGSIWARVTDYVFDDPVAAGRQLAPQLRQQADLVVCLSHCGEATDTGLAAIADIDLVLGGHTHRNGVADRPGQALVVYPGHHGGHVAVTELTGRADARSRLMRLAGGP